MESIDFFLKLRIKIPFLQQVPDSIYFTLETKEFILPKGELLIEREELEKLLNHFVMTYKAKADGVYGCTTFCRHLCGNIRSADLSLKQKKILKAFESRWIGKGVSFCIYQKPIYMQQNSCLFHHSRLQLYFSWIQIITNS